MTPLKARACTPGTWLKYNTTNTLPARYHFMCCSHNTVQQIRTPAEDYTPGSTRQHRHTQVNKAVQEPQCYIRLPLRTHQVHLQSCLASENRDPRNERTGCHQAYTPHNTGSRSGEAHHKGCLLQYTLITTGTVQHQAQPAACCR